MKLRYAFLCEYATTRPGPTTAVGIFDTLTFQRSTPADPIQFGVYFIVVAVECPSGFGPRHLMTYQLKDDDGNTLFTHETPFQLGRSNERLPLSGAVVCGVSPMGFPSDGSYTWAISVDGVLLGEIPLIVVELPQPAPAT
jgi:hypothetical protein